MENKNIKSINTIGKVGNIVTIVIQVVMIVGIISSIIAGIVILQLHNDSIRVSGSGNADITLKTSQLVSRVIEIDNIDNSTFKLDMFGIKAKITTRSEDISDDENNYQISAEADGVTGREIKVFFAATCFTGAIVVALFLIASVFVRKLAKVLSKCRSPFEESVIKAMRAFGISLIPWAVFRLCVGSTAGVAILLLAFVIFLLVKIFKYGAELQQESDETL